MKTNRWLIPFAAGLLAAAVGSAYAVAPRATVPTDREMDELEAAMEASNNSDIETGLGKGIAIGSSLVNIYDSWEAFTAASDALTPDDLAFDPDVSPPGSPEIPSACAESEECNACYEQAVKDINFYRFSFDKGHRIAHSYLEYAKAAIAFGDTGSAAMDVGGLAWSLEARPGIVKATDKLRATYDAKYKEWLSGMEGSLKELGKCEEEHFGERDWYGRFGYIYYSFIADRYKSPD
jgi:hypothetical protein